MLLVITIIITIVAIIVDLATIQKILYKPPVKVYDKWVIDDNGDILFIDVPIDIEV